MFTPRVHYLMTLIHITCALFWLGWMVFFSLIMVPVLRQEVPEKFFRLRAIIQSRTRSVLNVMLVLLVLTGIYNMKYRGLMNLRTLFGTEMGLWFVLKLFLATFLIGLYWLAPRFVTPDDDSRGESTSSSSRRRNVFLFVHWFILLVGLSIGYLGITIGG